jgi:transposase-like protein
MAIEQYCTLNKLSRDWEVSKQTLYSWVRKGKVISKKEGRSILIDKNSYPKRRRTELTFALDLFCPECASEKLQKFGFVMVNRKEVQRYKCKACLRITHRPVSKEVAKD